MILDKQNLFTDGKTVTSRGYSDVLDLGAAGMGKGNPVLLFCQVVEAYTGGDSLTVALETAATSGGSYTTVKTAGPVATASLAAGYRFGLGALPENVDRFVRLKYTVAGTMTAGKLTAGLALDLQTNV